MIYEVCELIKQHLKDPAMGIDALAPSVPLAVGDPAIEFCTIVSEFDITYLPTGSIPPSAYKDGPLVLVRRGDDIGEFAPPGNPEILEADGRIGVAILALYPRESANTLDQENRRLSALLRVIRRSCELFFQDVPIESRDLREVRIVGPLGGARLVPTVARIGGEESVDLMAGAILLDLKVTDRWAEGITAITP
jgi:hypothetical protein